MRDNTHSLFLDEWGLSGCFIWLVSPYEYDSLILFLTGFGYRVNVGNHTEDILSEFVHKLCGHTTLFASCDNAESEW